MHVSKNKPFARFARKNEIGDEELCKAVASEALIEVKCDGKNEAVS
jgi:hypothetical protein